MVRAGLIAVLLAGLVAPAAHAGIIQLPVDDASFETTSGTALACNPTGVPGNDCTTGLSLTPFGASWTANNATWYRLGASTNYFIAPNTPNGSVVATIYSGVSSTSFGGPLFAVGDAIPTFNVLTQQIAGTTALATMTYTLTVAVGDRVGALWSSSKAVLGLAVGGKVVSVAQGAAAQTDGTWRDLSVSYTAGAADTGKTITVILGESGLAGWFDNVRLAANLPEPASLLLLAAALAPLAAARRRGRAERRAVVAGLGG